MSNKLKILVTDIETSPSLSYHWRMFDENIGIDQIVTPSRITCASFKWHGEAGITFYSEWYDGSVAMLWGLHDALSQADAVVTFNGDKFDLPRLNGEFIAAGLPPVAPVTSIDLRKTTKKLGLQSGKLDWVVQYYNIGKKIETEGFKLWRGIEEGDLGARARMEKYNKHDVRLTDSLYKRLRPYMTKHPHLTDAGACPNCGHDHLRLDSKYRYTRTTKVQRLQCLKCGSWSDGARSKIK